jgi:hypothetical protein
MNLFKGLHDKIDNWLHGEEGELVQAAQARQARNRPTEEQLEVQRQEASELVKAELAKISGEDHSIAPTKEDVDRYYEYHENFVTNVKEIEKRTGQKPPFDVPSSVTKVRDFNKKAIAEGWEYLRRSCGLPMGDPFTPRKPWVMAQVEKRWSIADTDQTWSTKEQAPDTPETPKTKKRGM